MKASHSNIRKAEMDNLICPTPAMQPRELLRDNPDLSYFQHLNYSEGKYRDAIRQETRQSWIELNKGQSPDPITNDRTYRKITQQVDAKYRQLHREHRARTLLWLQSERILNLLRTKGLTPTPTQDQVDEAMLRFVQGLDLTRFPEMDESTPHLGPNQYFELSRPQLVADYGYPFYSTVAEDAQQDTRQERIIGLNSDFWAAFLGGDKRLMHDCVFSAHESRFYYFDVVLGCYVPTSEEKLRLAASQALQQRAWGQDIAAANMILDKFRTKKALDEIITKAKAILAADDGYFEARPRWGQKPKVDPVEVVACFVQEYVEPADGYVMSLAECLEHLERTCPVGLRRKETAEKINEIIRATFHRGLRNDLILNNGRGGTGWKGLRLRVSNGTDEALKENLALVRQPGLTVEPEVKFQMNCQSVGLIS